MVVLRPFLVDRLLTRKLHHDVGGHLPRLKKSSIIRRVFATRRQGGVFSPGKGSGTNIILIRTVILGCAIGHPISSRPKKIRRE